MPESLQTLAAILITGLTLILFVRNILAARSSKSCATKSNPCGCSKSSPQTHPKPPVPTN